MRTLGEILESAKSGQRPTPDECYWAMLALEALNTFDALDFLHILERGAGAISRYVEEQFQRRKRAFAADPQVWVGPNNDPSNPDVQARRKLAFKILAKSQSCPPKEAPRE